MTLFLSLALLAAIVTFFGSWAVYRLAHRYRIYAGIRDRDVHSRPTPRLGGLAMFLGIVTALIAAWLLSSRFTLLRVVFADPAQILAILGAAFLIVVIGVLDDLFDLDWLTKLAGQFLAAGLVAWQGVQILSLPIGGVTVGSGWMSALVTVFSIVLVMNAVNFIDGLDGLVAGISLIGNAVFFLYTYLLVQNTSPSNYFNLASLLAVLVVGVCVGFLPFNWHPARLFMGDSGALLIGLLMATSAVAATGQVDPASLYLGNLVPAFLPIILPFAVLTIPLLDFTLAVIRRVRAGRSPFSADRKHLHHRLLDMGHGHLGAVLILYCWAGVASVSFFLTFVLPMYFKISAWWAVGFLAVGFCLCVLATVAPLTSRKRRATLAEGAGAGELDGKP